MKANELMIGDWLEWKHPIDKRYHGIYRVAAVEETWVDFYDEEGNCCSQPYEEIFPIPLTEEILEKNEFEELMSEGWESAARFGRTPKPTGVLQFGFGQFDSVSYLPKRSFLSVKYMEGCMADFVNIKYVHELQHALRLCGVEKEIIL